jgi:FkbM family methyltransferase
MGADGAGARVQPLTKHEDLVFDVGMHRGDDTAHYLARGFRVVAVEADPQLAEAAGIRFADEVAAGRLTIVAAAVSERDGPVEFALADAGETMGSADARFIARSESWGVHHRRVQVPGVRFADLLRKHGVPHYMKVDIEGSDLLCVRALREIEERPDFVSLESAVTAPHSAFSSFVAEMVELWSLGYRDFKFRDQTQLPPGFPPESSGPFGEETPGRWLRLAPALGQAFCLRLIHELTGYGGRWEATTAGRANRKLRELVTHRAWRWYDLHARLGPAPARIDAPL